MSVSYFSFSGALSLNYWYRPCGRRTRSRRPPSRPSHSSRTEQCHRRWHGRSVHSRTSAGHSP